jgi:hypothetical protein
MLMTQIYIFLRIRGIGNYVLWLFKKLNLLICNLLFLGFDREMKIMTLFVFNRLTLMLFKFVTYKKHIDIILFFSFLIFIVFALWLVTK